MGHYALLDYQNIVTKVCTGKDENQTDSDIELLYQNMFDQLCKRTSYNTIAGVHYDSTTNEPSADQSKAFRKNYAGVGYTYDQQRDAFIPPKTFDSWVLNEQTCQWEAPIAYPKDEQAYYWNEENLNWELITE